MSSKGVNLPLTGSTCKPKSSKVVTPRSMGVFSVAMATRDVTLFPSIVMYASETGYSTISPLAVLNLLLSISFNCSLLAMLFGITVYIAPVSAMNSNSSFKLRLRGLAMIPRTRTYPIRYPF